MSGGTLSRGCSYVRSSWVGECPVASDVTGGPVDDWLLEAGSWPFLAFIRGGIPLIPWVAPFLPIFKDGSPAELNVLVV